MKIKDNLILHLNVLFILFTKDFGYNARNTVFPKKFPVFLPSDECVAKPKPEHMEKRIAMHKIFGIQFSEFREDYTFPIAKITLAISALIASNMELRMRFFARYERPVPGITQFLFDIFRVGELPDGSQITHYTYSNEYLEYLDNMRLEDCFLYDLNENRYDEHVIGYIIWFNQLNKIDNHRNSLSESSNFYFHNYAPLIKTSLNSQETLYFSGLSFGNDSVLWFQESTNLDLKLKEDFLLISAALNTRLFYQEENWYDYPEKSLVYGMNQANLLESFVSYIVCK